MVKAANLTVIIPAAGQASRLGSPKQLLPWQGETLITYCCKKALSLQPSQVLVVLGAYKEAVNKQLESLDVKTIENSYWSQGLGSSIAVAASHILKDNTQIEAVLVLLPDQPLIGADYLNKMLNNFKKSQQQIVATSYGSSKLGVPALFDSCYLPELAKLGKDFGARDLIKEHSRAVSCINSKVDLSDIDTMEDYKRLLIANRQ